MPVLRDAFGSAFFANGCGAGKGARLLTGLFQNPTLHLHKLRHGHDSNDFLIPHVTSATPTTHEDFLFCGRSPVLQGEASVSHDAACVKAETFSPKLSMMAGATELVKAVAEVARKQAKRLDPFEDGREEREPPSGWGKYVPRGLKMFVASDLFSFLVLTQSIGDTCDWPLKTWLVGGILLGYPVSRLVHSVASARPSFQFYRLVVRGLRDGGPPGDAKLDGLVLFDQFSLPIERAYVEERQEGMYWFATLKRDGAELVTGYQLVTHRTAAPGLDPVSWTLEGSADGVDWQSIDECEGQPVPRERGAATALFEDLLHLEDATSAFRGAFLLEVAANAAALAWLVAGTAWVSSGTETCVDSAPLLWYSCYLIVVTAWSFLGTMTIGLIVSAVAMIVLGVRSPSA
mmetsp:Transcript_90911/g.294182  ORF Transcript_90911/g.294182 Transcript_90911/m.294182 type:complete len:403 (-) Transcript_90911:76-1284(-)